MYPYGGLPENVVAFCDRLRRSHEFLIGPAEVRDAARALEIANVASGDAVRDCWRPILCSRLTDVAVFDRAFDEFFFPGPEGAPQTSLAGAPRASRDARGRDPQGARKLWRPAEDERGTLDDGVEASGQPLVLDDEDDREAPSAGVRRARWSPVEGESAAPALSGADEEWRAGARALVRRVHAGRARRWRPAATGHRFDLRRTFRRSLHTGGEPIVPRWQARPRRHPRFVLLVDASRSMQPYAAQALDLALALAAASTRVEVFVFSTALARVTSDIRRAAFGRAHALDELRHAWGGGTTIGGCLRAFIRQFGERLVSRDSLVMIVSDGLDVGAADVLREAMRDIHRRAAGVVWLNPLLETPGYEPTAQGMRVARPYVTTFSSVGRAADLRRLARIVRLRA